MLIVIGKAFSKETNQTRSMLESAKISYRYIDLEVASDRDYWKGWIKSNKILSIPVVLLQETHYFVVGHDPEALRALLKRAELPMPQ